MTRNSCCSFTVSYFAKAETEIKKDRIFLHISKQLDVGNLRKLFLRFWLKIEPTKTKLCKFRLAYSHSFSRCPFLAVADVVAVGAVVSVAEWGLLLLLLLLLLL